MSSTLDIWTCLLYFSIGGGEVSVTTTLAGRLRRPVFFWAMFALVAEFGIGFAEKRGLHLRLYLRLLPIVAMFFFIIALARVVGRMDELQRRICEQSAFVAFLLTIALTLVFAGLERATFYFATWDDVGTALIFLWACAYVFFSWRYK